MSSIRFFIIACLICYSANGLPDTQIVGGDEAEEGKYPYVVSIKDLFQNHFCGGAIVSEKYVITAAHCAEYIIYFPSLYQIGAGSNSLTSQTIHMKIDDIIIHKGYVPFQFINDIAVIKLRSKISFARNVQKIDIMSEDIDFTKKNLMVTGWGWDAINGTVSKNLRNVTLSEISTSQCRNIYGDNISNQHICTFSAYNKGVCLFDSGGALTYKDKLVGIVSHGVSCAVGQPDVFTRVFYFKSWLDPYINAGNADNAGNAEFT
ncbi:chymotrypsin-2-like [Cardiocondyla obscurior]|uniref:chymotrypsin-2-like n=1 Tax=Cardiocondyla obscurior TaxID=286306 RepID=UPI0039657818